MANKEIKLLDVIDRAQLQSLQDAFAKATGMAALATDKNGPVTQLSCPTDFCMNYTRKSSVGCERCNLCDLKGGEQASQLAAQHFAQLAAMPSRTRQDIDDTLARAQHDILDLGDRLGGVAGTTCSGLVLPQDHADSTSARSAALFSDADDQDFSDQTYVVNVGDSRTYHLSPLAHADAPATDIIPVWDAASLIRITRDHSQRQEAIDSGQMLPEEAEATIPRNIITQCLGDPDGIMPDVYVADLTGRFIICSDGLHGEVPDEQIAAIAAAHSSPQEAVDALVAAALDAGGTDNITVIVADMPLTEPEHHAFSAFRLDEGEDIGAIEDATLQTLRTIRSA